MNHAQAGATVVRYEAALWCVLGAMAYLARDNSDMVYPDILWLFALLLGVSLASAWALRRWPRSDKIHAFGAVLSFCVIAAIQSRSGGADSNLWVLYLLPLFTSALLLRGRELALIAAGAVLCDAVLYAGPDSSWGASVLFELAVKTGVLTAAAASTWARAEAERRVRARAAAQRAQLERLTSGLRTAQTDRERDHALAAVGLLTAGAAHDMSTPLMVIRGYARMRLDSLETETELRKDLERIDRAAAFCQKLTASTLAQARGAAPAAGGQEYALVGVLESALTLGEEVLEARRVRVRRDYAEGDFTVRGEPQELERLFLNLIANAAKAMPDGGTLTASIRARGTAGAREALVRIDDTGRGIPAEVLPKLFSAFATTRAAEGGTGLGLYLGRETARRLGGDLTAQNLTYGGASFRVRLPLVAVKEPAAA